MIEAETEYEKAPKILNDLKLIILFNMRSITPELNEELKELSKWDSIKKIATSDPINVNHYTQLLEYASILAYINRDYVLFFRGQTKDYKNKESSSFYPSIYRGTLNYHKLKERFTRLEYSCQELKERCIGIKSYKDLIKRKYVQWSILQHYEICDTPLLDFSQSLRVACSFAATDNDTDLCYLFVFAFPYPTNRISINSEHDLVNIRLLSICPPEAKRPYYQEGFLAGTCDITEEYEQKSELDFNNRLVVKFTFPNNETFWNSGFEKIRKDSLYPDTDDRMYEIAQEIKNSTFQLKTNDPLMQFIQNWATLETDIKRGIPPDIPFSKALNYNVNISFDLKERIIEMYKYRNHIIHRPNAIKLDELQIFLNKLDYIMKEYYSINSLTQREITWI